MNTWLLFATLLFGQTPLDQANKALLEGNYPQAYTLYQQVLQEDPNQYEALTNAAFAATKLGKPGEAFDLYWRAWQIKKDPQRVGKPLVDLGLQLGTRYTLEKKWADAERVFRIVTSVAAENDVAWFNLGYALEQQGKLEEALTAYRKARDLNPSNTVIAAINRVQGELDRQRTARLNTLRRRAERALGRGDTTRALALMDSVLRLDPRNAWARSTKAQILEIQQTRARLDSLRQVLASLLAQDSLKALPVVEQLLSLTPEDSQLLALRNRIQALRQQAIQAAAQTQKTEARGFPVGLVIGGVVVLLLIVGLVLLLRGRGGEEVPAAYRAPAARPKTPPPSPRPQPQPAPEAPAPEPPAPTSPTEPSAPAAGTPGRIRVIEGIPPEEGTGEEEPTPRDVVIREKKPEAPKPPTPPTGPREAPPEKPEVPEPSPTTKEAPPAPEQAKEVAAVAEEKPQKAEEPPAVQEEAPPAETPPKTEEKVVTAEPKAPVRPPEKQPPEKPTPPAEEEKKPEKPAAAPARPVRARGFGGVNAIKERAKKKRRLLLLQMLREALASGQEGVFGSKELEAYIYMKEGRILQAEYRGKTGPEALEAILENPKPDRFSFRQKDTFFVEGDLNLTVADLDQQIEALKKEV